MATIGRTIAAKVSIDWDFDGSYTEETGRLVSARGSHRLAPPGQSISGTSGQIAQMSIELDNSDNRYSPLIAAGALYSSISGGQMYRMPIQVEVAIDGGSYEGVFVGVLKIPRNRTLAPGQPKTITLDARGNEERILNTRLSTEQADFVAYHDDGMTEGDIIADILLNQVGLDPGEVSTGDGMFPIEWFAMDNESVIEACWRLAAACGGRFYCNKGGLFVFEPMYQWLIASRSLSSQKTLTRADFTGLTLYYDDTNLASKIAVSGSLYEFGESGELWSASAPLTIPAGATRAITAELNSMAYQIDSVTYTARTAGGTDLSADVTLTRTDYAERVLLSFENANTTLPVIISGLTITGVGVEVAERFTAEATEASSFWDAGNVNRQPASLANPVSSPYIQSRAHAQAVADWLRDRQQDPSLFCVAEGIQGDAALRLGDRITITDGELMDSSKEFYLIALDWSYSVQGGFRQSLVGIACEDVFAYSGGSVSGGYFTLSTSGGNTLGSGSSKPGKLFY